jgi:hypothetical protein
LHTENWLCNLPGSALKVPVVVVVVVVVVGGGWLESKLSDQLWLSFSLALAKPNKNKGSASTPIGPKKNK